MESGRSIPPFSDDSAADGSHSQKGEDYDDDTDDECQITTEFVFTLLLMLGVFKNSTFAPYFSLC